MQLQAVTNHQMQAVPKAQAQAAPKATIARCHICQRFGQAAPTVCFKHWVCAECKDRLGVGVETLLGGESLDCCGPAAGAL